MSIARFDGSAIRTESDDFGTVIVHTHANRNEFTLETPDVKAKELSTASTDTKSDAAVNNQGEVTSLRTFTNKLQMVEENQDFQIREGISSSAPESPEDTLNRERISQSQGHGSSATGGTTGTSSTVKGTVSRKAFAVQDKLWSIYAAGNTVPIPFLKAIDISPLALVSDNVLGNRVAPGGSDNLALEAIKELFSGDGQAKKPRKAQNEVPLPASVHERLTTSSTLMNLAQALAYHKTCYEDMPLQELQAAQEKQTIQNLCDTLRTILRL
ncbi:hypothetical protein Taro_045249 [Colocasia esculenta]|uniref:Uncharacterized protein n=1 Tax=Colocasia esculenta TaxID=4460 RepID=A0A843WNZ4_COLES|nr:hypothetical protein [Colocasia esculenta]